MVKVEVATQAEGDAVMQWRFGSMAKVVDESGETKYSTE
jgi:hypothetical protein